MRWISTTIKRKYMDKILAGDKKIEYKRGSNYWRKRILPLMHRKDELDEDEDPDDLEPLGITFVCGQDVYKFELKGMMHVTADCDVKEIDGETVQEYFALRIGKRIEDNNEAIT